MTPLKVKFIKLDEVAWDDLRGDEARADKIELAVIDKATHKGHPGVVIRFDGEDGIMLGLTTARLFLTAAKMIEARYPGLMEEPD